MHKGKGCKRTWGCYNYSIYYKTVGPVTTVKIPGSAGGTAFILGHHGTDAGHTWHGFLAGLSMYHLLPGTHISVVWQRSSLMMHLEQ